MPIIPLKVLQDQGTGTQAPHNISSWQCLQWWLGLWQMLIFVRMRPFFVTLGTIDILFLIYSHLPPEKLIFETVTVLCMLFCVVKFVCNRFVVYMSLVTTRMLGLLISCTGQAISWLACKSFTVALRELCFSNPLLAIAMIENVLWWRDVALSLLPNGGSITYLRNYFFNCRNLYKQSQKNHEAYLNARELDAFGQNNTQCHSPVMTTVVV